MKPYPKPRLKGMVQSERDLLLLFLDLKDLAEWLAQFPPDQATLDQFLKREAEKT